MVGESPELEPVVFKRAGPAIGLEAGSFKLFKRGARCGELCLIGERTGECRPCRCNVGLALESTTALLGATDRGEACLVGENPGDDGAWRWKFGPAVGLEDGT